MKNRFFTANKNLSLLFYVLWFVLSCIQIRFTELMHDEAYYWAYSTRLDWGYFDHPPMIAVMIKWGYALFHNELGVRLFAAITNVLMLYITEKIVNPQNKPLFYVLVSSIAFLQVGSILAIPDSPLLFFSVCFFYVFEKYLAVNSTRNTLLLGVCMALLIYSKYHGALLIIFCFLLNIRLLKQMSFWVSILLALILLIPHIYWQIQHDFPSFHYHLQGRSLESYSISNTWIYLVTQPLVYGPFIGFWLFYALFTFKPKDSFQKTLKGMAVLTFAFFLLMTTKGVVEGNWTIIALFPLIYISYHELINRPKLIRVVYGMLPLTLVLIFTARLYLMWDFLPKAWGVQAEFHNNKAWAKDLEKVAHDTPVAFMNSYKRAAKYAFYSGHPSFSMCNVTGRQDQYVVWDSEFTYQGKTVVLFFNYVEQGYPFVQTVIGPIQYTRISNFLSTGNVKITADKQQVKIKKGDSLSLRLNFSYTNLNWRNLAANKEYPSYIRYVIFKENKPILEDSTGLQLTNSMMGNSASYPIKIAPQLESGTYNIALCTKTGWMPPTINGNYIDLTVLK